jgi:hypothetical protein
MSEHVGHLCAIVHIQARVHVGRWCYVASLRVTERYQRIRRAHGCQQHMHKVVRTPVRRRVVPKATCGGGAAVVLCSSSSHQPKFYRKLREWRCMSRAVRPAGETAAANTFKLGGAAVCGCEQHSHDRFTLLS